MTMPCPICNIKLISYKKYSKDNDKIFYNCQKCGIFGLTSATETYLLNLNLPEPQKKQKMALITNYIHDYNKYNTSQNILLLEKTIIETDILNNPFPTPMGQIDRFILFLGNESISYGTFVNIDDDPSLYQQVIATTCCLDNYNYEFLTSSTEKLGLVQKDTKGYSLTLTGWTKHLELKKDRKDLRKAFMAMQFSNKDLGEFFEEYIRPEIKKTGFDIFKLNDKPEHGLIDDRLRVELRNSRFLIVDLTDKNNGAYWEAGYAEALGKKVFYICNKKAYDENKEAMKKDEKIKSLIHFDTEHQQIYFWDKNNPEKFISDLKYSIRLAFSEAIQEDK